MKKIFFLFLFPLHGLFAQTFVSGGIFSDTVWTKANSPFIVTGTVAVYPGITLTIEPGVTVRFQKNQMLEIKQGKLIAEGTNTDSITFTADSLIGDTALAYWNSIYLNGGNLVSKFNYCNFSYADSAIGAKNVTYLLGIKNSIFNFNRYGCSVNKVLADSVIFYRNNYGAFGGKDTSIFNQCNFIDNGTGIRNCWFTCGTTLITNCNFSENYYAIFNGSSSAGGIVNCTNCDISNNKYGISALSGNIDGKVNVENCIFSSNDSSGIINSISVVAKNCIFSNNNRGVTADTVTFINCTISNNAVGTSAVKYGSAFNCTISNNSVWGMYGCSDCDSCNFFNNFRAIGSALKVSNSDIINNYDGGIYGGYNTIITNCRINNNGNYGINVEGGKITDCEIKNNNFYGIKTNNGPESTIENCIITSNDNGVYLYYGHVGGGFAGNTVKNCIIDSNKIGIITNLGTNKLLNNIITNNDTGIKHIHIGVLYPGSFSHNIIENNHIGIYSSSAIDTITCNKICNNTEYNLVYANSQNTNSFSNNYWCSSDSVFIASTIYDGYDTVTGVGIVYFTPIDTEECYLTPITGIEQNNDKKQLFTITPNPNRGIFQLTINKRHSEKEKAEIKIYNLFGEVVYSLPTSDFGLPTIIDLSNQPHGIYFLHFYNNNTIVGAEKLIIAK